jgi:hypothetical protein
MQVLVVALAIQELSDGHQEPKTEGQPIVTNPQNVRNGTSRHLPFRLPPHPWRRPHDTPNLRRLLRKDALVVGRVRDICWQ